jgi:basic amino acid/polyamine antiporter, APA family
MSEPPRAVVLGNAPTLRRTIGRFQYFALAFGAIVGSAWLLLEGEWLSGAGPLGVVVGFVAGGLMVGLVALCYAELTYHLPWSGGEFVYAYEILGPRSGFVVGWFLTLYLVSVAAFEGCAFPWMLETLWPALRSRTVYRLLGADVTLDGLAFGLGAACLITYLNYRDLRAAMRMQSVITYGFLIVVIAVAAMGFIRGEPRNLLPLVSREGAHPWWVGAAWIFATCSFWLNGFQAVPQAIEERADDLSFKTVSRVMVGAVFAAAAFYCAIVISTSMATPWTALAGQEMAPVLAVRHLLPHQLLSTLLLIAAAVSLFKSWNAAHLIAARLVMVQARVGFLPAALQRIHPGYRTPGNAVLFVGCLNIAGILLGRGAVSPIVNMASVCLTLTYVLAFIELYRLRRRLALDTTPRPKAQVRVPGGNVVIGLGLIGTLVMSGVALAEPWIHLRGRFPLEWTLILGWAAAGFCCLLFARTPAATAQTPTLRVGGDV